MDFMSSCVHVNTSAVTNVPCRENTDNERGYDPLEEEMTTCSSILPGESHGQRSLAGYSPWGHKSRTRLNDETTPKSPVQGADCGKSLYFLSIL